MRTEPEDLRTRTKRFALGVVKQCAEMPRTSTAQVLGKQLLRSGTSVGANYREAYRSRSDAEFLAKMGDCLKELEETSYWLELLIESGLFPTENLVFLRDESDQLTAIFVTIIKRKRANVLLHEKK